MSGAYSTAALRAPLALRGHDLYETPPEAIRALTKVEVLPRFLWEPACGPGAIVRILRADGHDVLATDLVDYSSEDQDYGNVDFLDPAATARFEDPGRRIITNPPFKDAYAFVRRALVLTDRVYMLLRLAFIESEKRRDILDGGQLARVYVFRNRLPMMHRDGWDGPRSSNAMAFAWFVWDRNHNGKPTVERISWEPTP